VNAYEGKAGMVYLQVKLLSMPERFEIYIVYKRRYVNTLRFLFPLSTWSDLVLVETLGLTYSNRILHIPSNFFTADFCSEIAAQ